jgi:HK97 family phage portal protein
MMAEQLDLPIVTKADSPAVSLGDTTTLPANWNALQESLWETLTFQRNVNVPFRKGTDNALGLSIAIQCAGIKARDIAKAEMQLWRKQGSAYRLVPSSGHWFARMLARRPNDYHSWPEFWRLVLMHYFISQNAYIWKDIRTNGEVIGFYPLPPARVVPLTIGRRMFYEFRPATEFERGLLGENPIRFPEDRIIHLRGRMYDGVTGLSNEKLGDPLFDLIGSIARFQTNLFKNDARQPIVFESKSANFGTGDQADAAFRRLKAQLREAVYKMAAYGDPILLEAGYEAKVIAQTARDAMTAEAFNNAVQRVCFLMEIPPSKIYALESVKYDNQATLNAQYATEILKPAAKDISEKFRLSLFTPEEQEIYWPEFDQLELLSGDPATLTEVVDTLLKSGVITINEARERVPLGLNPLAKGGDVRYLPTSFALVDEDGEIRQLGATGQPNNDGVTEAPPKE